MEQHKIDYYNNLGEQQQSILKIAATVCYNFDYNTLYNLQLPKYAKKLTTSAIHKLIMDGNELVKVSTSYPYQVSISPDFLVFIFPQLVSEKMIASETKRPQTRIGELQSLHILYQLLRSLWFDEKKIPENESEFMVRADYITREALSNIIGLANYKPYITLLQPTFVEYLINIKIQYYIKRLDSITLLAKDIEEIQALYNAKDKENIRTYKLSMQHLFSGQIARFKLDFENIKTPLHEWADGLLSLQNGKPVTAINHFEMGNLIYQTEQPLYLLPQEAEFAFFYVLSLLCQPSDVATKKLKKLSTYIKKTPGIENDSALSTMVFYGLQDVTKLKLYADNLINLLGYAISPRNKLWILLALYVVDEKPRETTFDEFEHLTLKAAKNGFKMLAYEAAFALKSYTTQQHRINTLYIELAEELKYKPMLANMERLPEWEKQLNTLLSVSGGTGSRKAQESESSRVVYQVEPMQNYIQPLMQKRNATGQWSAGRNIALKTFAEGKAEHMTEQDIRIARKVVKERSYYGDNYVWTHDAIYELAGHPYLFLYGSVDVPIELILSQPELRITKTKKGYTVQSNVSLVGAVYSTIVTKETNTRYHVYKITPQQRVILNTFGNNHLEIPEEGKDKLMQVLGQISGQVTIHSDLVQTENKNMQTVPADNRIRVQLLPMGDGLKAELFVKPFGSIPPYCKPGVGGKTLITTVQGEQLQVKRSIDTEKANATRIFNEINTQTNFDISDGLMVFDNPKDALILLDILLKLPDIAIVEWPEGERFKIKKHVGFEQLKLKVKSTNNWFELQGELTVDEETVLTIQQLIDITAKSHNQYVELKPGEFLVLSKKLKQQLEALQAFTSVGKNGLQINKFASIAMDDFFDSAAKLNSDKAFKEFRKNTLSNEPINDAVPTNLLAELRPYQEEGFRWMARLASWEGGACLADDMGLGKTIQTLAILLHRAHEGPALVVCPVSVQPNWISETTRFAPSLNIKTLTSGNREETFAGLEAGDILVASYGLIQSEAVLFAKAGFATIILDEAHSIKNFTTKTSKAVMMLQAPFRVALTGTPVQNHLGEVWNLFNFINPGLLGTLAHFTDRFIKNNDEASRKHLKKLIAPFILRRTKSAVLDELPQKTEIVKKVELSTEEMAFYETLRRQAIAALESDDGPQGAKHLKALAEITKLRQACCNPLLVNPDIKIGSTKLNTFLEIVAELIENNHRALVFSQFVTHLAIVKKALDQQGISYKYLDGSTPMAEREKQVKAFQAGEGELFLISLKAGGLGLNLTAADYVIHMDPWWNPAVEDQASDRAHRYGQTRPVTIYRIVAQNTIEEKIIQLHNTKRDLADTLLEGTDQSAKLSVTELMSLIREDAGL